jgi:nucleoside-diphosphate kinase
MERTFAIIKPDATAKGYTGKILQRIEEAGFRIHAMKTMRLTKTEAEGFYAVHRERPFFQGLTEFMSSGPIVAMVLEAPDAIKKWRTLMGATDPQGVRQLDRRERHAWVGCARHGGLRNRVFLCWTGARRPLSVHRSP